MGALKKVMKKPDFGAVPQQSQPSQFKPQVNPQPKIQQPTVRNHPEQQNVKPIESVEKETQPEPQNPQDWLKPKIFKGTGLV
jgi:hypothetical protein